MPQIFLLSTFLVTTKTFCQYLFWLPQFFCHQSFSHHMFWSPQFFLLTRFQLPPFFSHHHFWFLTFFFNHQFFYYNIMIVDYILAIDNMGFNASHTSRNQPKCNHSIYDYMRLVVVCDRLFATIRQNFNYFGHSHNYDATIKNFILLVRSNLCLCSSINRLICPIYPLIFFNRRIQMVGVGCNQKLWIIFHYFN